MTTKRRKLVASAKPGVHQVKIYKAKFVQTYVYARIRKATFDDIPTKKTLMSAIFRMAHNILKSKEI